MTRFGVDWGRVTLTMVGSQTHYEYRAVGDTVNTATRIQDLNKKLGTRVLVSEPALEGVETFLLRDVGHFLLRGKALPVHAFELIGPRETAAPRANWICASALRMRSLHCATAHRKQALGAFRSLAADFPEDGPGSVLRACTGIRNLASRRRNEGGLIPAIQLSGPGLRLSCSHRVSRPNSHCAPLDKGLFLVGSRSSYLKSFSLVRGVKDARFRWIALQGSSRGFLPPLLLLFFLITSGIPALAADVSAACSPSVARVVSIQGSIELLRAHQNDWSRVTRLDTPLCEGDRLRTGALSRAALFIQPETLVRVDQNTSISVSQTAEETLVEFTQSDIVATSETAHSCGAGYFITRFPRKFKVTTPHLSAAVEGTEFLVAMRCESTSLSVFEGKVLAASAGAIAFPSQSVASGQTLTVGGTEPPAIRLLVKPADAVQWTLYYPPITPAGRELVEDCDGVAQENRATCLISRAERLLRTGSVEGAQVDISDALAADPYSSDAKALSSIISLVRNDKTDALRLAREAVDATGNSAPAWLALSYAQQADFKLEAALTSAQRAAELTPTSALALARVAELQLSLGWTREAEKTARQAVAANPSESRAHMILGFVHLAQVNVEGGPREFRASHRN